MELTSGLIAEYASELTFEDLSQEAVEQAELLVLDSVGCSVGAYASPPSKVLRRVYGERPAAEGEGATVFGSGRTVPVEDAALVNAALVRYFDYNDCYISARSVCHPSDHIPALVSVAEAEGATGRELITAIALAYEVEGLGVDSGAFWENGFDYVTWGAYSGAAAAGKLMGLTEDQLVDALGIAGTAHNGLLASRLGDVSMWKGVAHPYVTHGAIQACQLARAGMTGPRAVFEGEGGVFEGITDGPVSVDALGGRDGAPYRITRTNVKPYACGYFMQAPIAGLLELLDDEELRPEELESIVVRTFDQSAQVLASPEKWSTDLNRETADHSIPYCLAVAAFAGDVSPAEFSPSWLEDERVHGLMGRVEVEADETLTGYRRDHPGEIPSVVEVEAGGERHERRVDYPPGHAKDPLSEAEIFEKVERLCGEFLDDDQLAAVREAASDLRRLDSVEPLVEAVRV